MPLKLSMDQHVPRAVTVALRQRGVDVLTPYEDGADQLTDPVLPDRALVHQRVVFTQDDDFLIEAAARQQWGTPFPSIIYMHQLNASLGRCAADLELLALACSYEELVATVTFLPL